MPPWAKGAVAGMVTVVVFTIVHDILISDIWFSLIPMLVAGAACGACLAWNYEALFPALATGTWLAFVGLYLASLLLLGLASVAVFDPMVPMSVLIAANEPPNALIAQATPLTLTWIVATAGVATAWRGRTVRAFLVSLATAAVVIVLLGLNVSVLGLVEFSADSAGVLGLFLALVALIMVGYAGAFLVAHRLGSRRASGST